VRGENGEISLQHANALHALGGSLYELRRFEEFSSKAPQQQQQQRSPQQTQPPPQQQQQITFSDSRLQNRAKALINEFLEQHDVQEVRTVLAESAKAIYGYLVLQIFDKVLNTSKEEVAQALEKLLLDAALAPDLKAARVEIEAAVAQNEELKCLVDTTLDARMVRPTHYVYSKPGNRGQHSPHSTIHIVLF
jgi:signal recognition particle GTPase